MSNFKRGIIIAALFGASGLLQAVYAAQTNTGCQGNCAGGGDTTNQGGTAYGGNGGTGLGVGVGIGVSVSQGGHGGAGGNAQAIGGAGGQGGSVVGSGNSSATGGSVIGSGNSANTNHNQSSASNSNSNTAYGGSGGSSSASNAGNTSNISVQGDTYNAPRIPVSTAYAPAVAPTAVCMGSSSGGVQGLSFGVSIGSSWTDSNCMLLEQVRNVAVVLGDKETAAAMMCSVPAYRDARLKIGKPCIE